MADDDDIIRSILRRLNSPCLIYAGLRPVLITPGKRRIVVGVGITGCTVLEGIKIIAFFRAAGKIGRTGNDCIAVVVNSNPGRMVSAAITAVIACFPD